MLTEYRTIIKYKALVGDVTRVLGEPATDELIDALSYAIDRDTERDEVIIKELRIIQQSAYGDRPLSTVLDIKFKWFCGNTKDALECLKALLLELGYGTDVDDIADYLEWYVEDDEEYDYGDPTTPEYVSKMIAAMGLTEDRERTIKVIGERPVQPTPEEVVYSDACTECGREWFSNCMVAGPLGPVCHECLEDVNK
jgi:hypothetical protein